MRLTACERNRLRAAERRINTRPNRSATGYACLARRMLCDEATADDGRHLHVKGFADIHRRKFVEHALKAVSAHFPQDLGMLGQRMLRSRPGEQIARDLNLKHPGTVYVNACRVLKEVRAICEEFDEDLSHGFESDLSART